MKRILTTLILLWVTAACSAETPSDSVAQNTQVVIKTSEGDITLQLFADKAPVTVANFLSYVDADF